MRDVCTFTQEWRSFKCAHIDNNNIDLHTSLFPHLEIELNYTKQTYIYDTMLYNNTSNAFIFKILIQGCKRHAFGVSNK